MIEAKIHLKEIHQDSQEYGSSDEFMVSRVKFDLEIDTRWFRNLTADLKQVVGSQYTEEAIEVSAPRGYRGPFNQVAFQDIVRKCFLGLVGPNGAMLGLGPGSTNIRMRNNRFGINRTETIYIDAPSGGW